MRLAYWVLSTATLLAMLLIPKDAFAYEWMIRHGKTACVSCHADPSGGSLLTDYGRSQSEEVLRTRYAPVDPDATPDTRYGEFALGFVQLPEGLTAGGDVRALGMYLKPTNAPAITKGILMQADAVAQYEGGRLRVNASVGYVHEGALAASLSHGAEDRLISRHHWVGVDLGEDRAYLLRAGRINLPFGLRSIEHTTFVRRTTQTDVNANQEHGIALSFNRNKIRAEAMLIAGNYQISPDDLRRRGYSAYGEYSVRPNLAVGLSSLITHADTDLETQRATWRQAHGAFARFTPWKPLVLSAEADFLVRSPRRRAVDAGFATIVRADFEVTRGVHLVPALEAKSEAFARDGASVGIWGSAWWFFLPHLDVRADFIYQTLAIGGARTDAITLLGQIHGFL